MVTNTAQTPETQSKKSHHGYILSNKKLTHDIYEMIFECSEVAAFTKAGQFVSILCSSLILRRPFSIANVDGNQLKIIYKLKGEGTIFLSKLKSGQTIDFIGPLGNGFEIENKKALLIGAGVGIAPLIYLAETLQQQNIEYKMLAGLKTFADIKELNNTHTCLITEDASSGNNGLVTEYIDRFMTDFKPDKIYACGPKVVLQTIVEKAQIAGIKADVALEEKFACGTGVCMGCIIEVYKNNEIVNKRICKDGPVFKGETVVW
jgi:dihydroorotate dehydrogenase electron transfer subunit